MSFGSNVTPKKFGKGKDKPKSWQCGCGRPMPPYIAMCKRCGKSRP